MKILCVEDGSVDIDAIDEEGLKDGKVLVYRQGARQPFVLEVDKAESKAERDLAAIKERMFEEIIKIADISYQGYSFPFKRISMGYDDLKRIILGDEEKT